MPLKINRELPAYKVLSVRMERDILIQEDIFLN